MKIDYGEILFVGRCNLQCFYCLGHEMHESTKCDTLNIHFQEWPNFGKWLYKLQRLHVKTIYLSSTNSEPLLYKYLSELIDFLQDVGFNVGIRTNTSLDTLVCNKCKEEISLSLQSLNPETFEKITGVLLTFDFLNNLRQITNPNVRVSIVVNRYNKNEIFDMLHQLRPFNLRYVQLRQCYKYYDDADVQPDIDAFNEVVSKLESFPVKGQFKESIIYDIDGLDVSIWRTVFKKESISSSNYWTNGIITENNLLVEGYEHDRK